MVEAAPASTLVVAEADFPFEFLVIPLDPPTSLCVGYKLGYRRVGWQRRQPVILQARRRPLAIRP